MNDSNATENDDVGHDGYGPDVRDRWEGYEDPSTAVVEMVAAARGRDPVNLSPLYDVVDPDALDALVLSRATDSDELISVTFTYEGFDVDVWSDGTLELYDRTEK